MRKLLLVLFLATAACGSSDPSPSNGPGNLQVNTTTTGGNLDPDGYNLMLDNTLNAAIGINGSVTVPDLPAGDVVIELANVAGNCTVAAPRRRTLPIRAEVTTTTTFSITCFSPP